MSSLPSPEHQGPASSSKPQRILACVQCQQRKVKCDRKFPCAHCTKARVPCVPATLTPRQRRRRFPERVLLERLRTYETLLRQHRVPFEPLHGQASNVSRATSHDRSEDERPDDAASPDTTSSERTYEANDASSDVERAESVSKAWDQLYKDGDHLLLGARKSTVDLSTLHPDAAQLFRLWQTYLDNVNPLLKVTHTPTLQPRIIEAASNVKKIDPNLEALMFGVYCMSVMSLTNDECQAMFAASKEELLTRYQFGCQEALFNVGYLRTGNLDCVTALFLYLVSVGPTTDPRSLSSMLGVAMRVSLRIGLHNESANARCSTLEAEMRRRLWWALVLFDARMGELADYKNATLSPIYDCKIPLNVNDFDLRSEIRKDPPAVQAKPTEAIFAVVRAELARFVGSTAFYLDFTNPALKPMARHGNEKGGSELLPLEQLIEEKYLQHCDPDNPFHFLTIWTSRCYIAKCRLVEFYANAASEPPTNAEREAALTLAFAMLNADTKIMNNLAAKRYHWLYYFYFPFPAYIHALQDLRKRPMNPLAEQAWETMSDNYMARFSLMFTCESPTFKLFSKIVLDAWEAREALSPPEFTPRIVSHIRAQLRKANDDQPGMIVGLDDLSVAPPFGFGSSSLLYGLGHHDGFTTTDAAFPTAPGSTAMDLDMSQFNWAAMSWAPGLQR